MTGADASNICYLRDIRDAAVLVDAMRAGSGMKAVVIGGGYIGMECTAALVANKLDVTMVYPESHCSKPARSTGSSLDTAFTGRVWSYQSSPFLR